MASAEPGPSHRKLSKTTSSPLSSIEKELENVVLKASDRVLPGSDFDAEAQKDWKEPYYFVQAADPQFGMTKCWTVNAEYPEVTWEAEIELCRRSVEVINALRPRPKFVVVCGDMLDAFPDEWPDIRRRQEEDFMNIYRRIDRSIPLVCACGNHDVGNTPTRETIASYKSTFGDDFFSFWVGGVHFLVLNSQYYFDGSKVEELAKEQDDWLDQQLALSREKGSTHLVLFQHIPWFLRNPQEEKDKYFNMDKDLRLRMLKKFSDAGVRKIFCGHYHRNAGGWYDESLEQIVTTAIGCQIGSDRSGMRIVRVFKDKVTHTYEAFDDFPTQVTLDH